MKSKKDSKNKAPKNETQPSDSFDSITSKADLKTFLLDVRDKMTEETAPPIYALGAINHVLNLPDVYTLLDNDNKELARDIWLRLKQSGFQVRNPPLLFGPDEAVAESHI